LAAIDTMEVTTKVHQNEVSTTAQHKRIMDKISH